MASPITNIASTIASIGTASIHAAPHRKNAAQRNPSDSPYQQRTTQRDNPTQVLIRQAVDYLIEQLEAGHSETLAAYLGTMARFHNYSFGNILQIARQRPDATRVAGFGAWKELGRFVKRGEKGIQILAPVVGYRRKKDDTEQEADSKPQPVLMGFRAVFVFERLSRDLWPRLYTLDVTRGARSEEPPIAAATSSLNFAAQCNRCWQW
jgi:hypothetical protein